MTVSDGHGLKILKLLFLLTVAAVKNAFAFYTEEQLDSLCAVQSKITDQEQRLEVLEFIIRNHKNLDSIGKYALIELRLAESVKNYVYAASAADVTGWLKYQKARYIEAGKYYKKAIGYYEETGNKLGKANAVMGLGNILFRLNKYNEGLDNAMSSLKTATALCDTAMMCSIYRALGNSCYEYQLYQTSYGYFERALQLDLKTGNTRSIGRDYFSMGRCYNNMKGGKSVEDVIKTTEFFKKAEYYGIQTGDYMFLIYENFMLALQYAELTLVSGQWNYADSSSLCYEKCKEYIEKIGFREFKTNLAVVRAVHSVLGGNYVQASEILSSYAKKKSLTNLQRRLFFRAYNIYFRYTKDYEQWFKYLEEDGFARRRFYISEFGVKLDLMDTKCNLELLVRQYDSIIVRNNADFLRRQENYDLEQKILISLIIGIAVLISVLVFFSVKNRRRNITLTLQKTEILEANSALDQLNREIESQWTELEKQTEEIKFQRNILEEINVSIIHNMQTAGRLQQSIMPSQELMQSLFENYFIIWRPLDIVSGDFFWARKIGCTKIVAVADCTGHGVPGACLSIWGIAMLNSIAARINPDTVNAAEILEMLRTRIVETLSKGLSAEEEEVHDGMDIALCVINTQKKKLTYSGAYRPLWIIRNGEFTELKADRMPVAIDHDHTAKFSVKETDLDGSETIYMFSDGITDQFGMKENGKLAKFQTARLRELLKEISSQSLETQKLKIENAIKDWAGGQPQTDDVLIIGLTKII